MRKKLFIGVFLAAIVGIVAGEYLFNRSGAQEVPKKTDEKKVEPNLFDALKKDLEAKKEVPPADVKLPPLAPLEAKDLVIPPPAPMPTDKSQTLTFPPLPGDGAKEKKPDAGSLPPPLLPTKPAVDKPKTVEMPPLLPVAQPKDTLPLPLPKQGEGTIGVPPTQPKDTPPLPPVTTEQKSNPPPMPPLTTQPKDNPPPIHGTNRREPGLILDPPPMKLADPHVIPPPIVDPESVKPVARSRPSSPHSTAVRGAFTSKSSKAKPTSRPPSTRSTSSRSSATS